MLRLFRDELCVPIDEATPAKSTASDRVLRDLPQIDTAVPILDAAQASISW